MEPPTIEIEQHDHIAIVRLNDPDRGNRIGITMARQLSSTFEDLRRADTVTACVLTGAGRSFCLGGDYTGAGPTAAGRLEFGRAFSDVVCAMERLGKPLVAAVNGNAHAGGLSLVVACDIGITSDQATFGLPEAVNGLFPLLALAIVKETIPKKVLFEMVYTARVYTALEAKALHIVNEVCATESVITAAVQRATEAGSRVREVTAVGRDLGPHLPRCEQRARTSQIRPPGGSFSPRPQLVTGGVRPIDSYRRPFYREHNSGHVRGADCSMIGSRSRGPSVTARARALERLTRRLTSCFAGNPARIFRGTLCDCLLPVL